MKLRDDIVAATGETPLVSEREHMELDPKGSWLRRVTTTVMEIYLVLTNPFFKTPDTLTVSKEQEILPDGKEWKPRLRGIFHLTRDDRPMWSTRIKKLLAGMLGGNQDENDSKSQ